jgi:hypothetical protein
MELKIEIKNKTLPAFAGFVEGSAKKGTIKILIDIEKNILVSADKNIDLYELLAENTVHELLHSFQELYKKAFNEKQVNDAIKQAKLFLNKNVPKSNMDGE